MKKAVADAPPALLELNAKAKEMAPENMTAEQCRVLAKRLGELKAEAERLAYDKEMSEAQEKIADHTAAVDKLSSKIDKASASIAQITESVAELQAQLADIAKQQAAMDEMRAEEKAAYLKAKKDYEDGVEGLTMALEILRDYYGSSVTAIGTAFLLLVIIFCR